MNMGQAIEALMPKYNGSRQEAEKALRLVIGLQMETVAKGDRFFVTGFGSLEKVESPARYARNPQTGERHRVESSFRIKWRPGDNFSAIINGSRELKHDDKGFVVFKKEKTRA